MDEPNPWNHIPLADYESHMQHEDVGQAQLLNYLTSKYLKQYEPRNVLFLGVSGGNGLEHLDTDSVERVCAIDINSAYLEETRERFGKKIKRLDLVNADIDTCTESLIQADFIWAALIFEYVNMEKCWQFLLNNTAYSSRLIVTIQANNGVQSVSKTGIESISGYFGEVDHLIPWQIDHLIVWRPVAEKSCRSSFKIS